MLFPTCNTYARTFTQSTTREEMKIVITYTLTHSLTHALTHALTHSLITFAHNLSITGIITFLSLSVAVDLKFQGIFGYSD